MSPHSSTASTSSEGVRRRRPATACISCRDRRVGYHLQTCVYLVVDLRWQVKCDHARPACFQCKKRGRDCRYPDPMPKSVEFVSEPLSSTSVLHRNDLSSSQTWSSVIEQQVDLVKKANIKAKSPGITVPFWTLAEAEEVCIPYL